MRSPVRWKCGVSGPYFLHLLVTCCSALTTFHGFELHSVDSGAGNCPDSAQSVGLTTFVQPCSVDQSQHSYPAMRYNTTFSKVVEFFVIPNSGVIGILAGEGTNTLILLCPHSGGIKRWCYMTSDVCRVHPVGGWRVLADRARFGRPGYLRLPLRASVAGLGGGISWRPPAYSLLICFYEDEPFQSITCTGTDNLRRTTKRQNTQIT